MDSTGLHLLIKAQQRLQEKGRKFAVIKGREQVERLLRLTRVADLLKIVDSPEELFEWVFADLPPHLARQRDEALRFANPEGDRG